MMIEDEDITQELTLHYSSDACISEDEILFHESDSEKKRETDCSQWTVHNLNLLCL